MLSEDDEVKSYFTAPKQESVVSSDSVDKKEENSSKKKNFRKRSISRDRSRHNSRLVFYV